MNGDSSASSDGRLEGATRNGDTAGSKTSATHQERTANREERAYVCPEHEEPDLEPLATSQYEPSAREVWKVFDHALSALLIATKPADPGPYRQDHWGGTNTSRLTTSKGNLHVRPGLPVVHFRATYGVAESNQPGDGSPAMLADEAVCTRITFAGPVS